MVDQKMGGARRSGSFEMLEIARRYFEAIAQRVEDRSAIPPYDQYVAMKKGSRQQRRSLLFINPS